MPLRRPLVGVAAALLALGALPGARASTIDVVVIHGKGWGHGVGMAQDGALALGRAGRSLPEILGTFYPGTALSSGHGTVRVVIDPPADAETVIAFPSGGDVRSPASGQQHAGFPVRVEPGGQVRISRAAGHYVVRGGTPWGAVQGAPPSAPPRSPEPVWAVPASDGLLQLPERGRTYRGVAEVRGDPFRVVNQVDVEQYLRGMGEVRDPSWPLASLQAQAIAARTYALRTMAAGGELCDTQRCQVYLGRTAEYAAMDHAVASTAGQVITYAGAFALTVYSANGGGHLASTLEGFGTAGAGYPYLRAAPYQTDDPMPWDEEIGLADVGTALAYPGTLHSVEVLETGPSGRAVQVGLRGDGGLLKVSGLAFADALGLRSTLFSVEAADVVRVPQRLPRASRLQSPPELLGARVIERDVTPVTEPAARPVALAPPRGGGGSSRAPWIATAVAALLEGVGGLWWFRRRAAGAPKGAR